MDFGIARVLGSEHFTHGGYMMGTPAYMAPEQVLGREIDGRADLYSVGVVLYRLLSGRLPFAADTAISMVQMQISEPPTPILSFKPDLPQWCCAIIDRALAKSPSDRFQSAEEFRSALLSAVKPQALGEMPTLATPTPPGLTLDPDATMPHRTPSSVRAAVGTAATAAAVATPQYALSPAVVVAQTPPTPTSIPPAERTGTTVVLGRTHLAAIVAFGVIVAIGIGVLAYAAFGRRGSSPFPLQVATQQTPSTPAPDPAAAPAAVSPPANAPASAPGTKPLPPPGTPIPPPATGDRGVATAGAGPAPVKPGAKPTAPNATTAPAESTATGRGAAAANATTTSTTTAPPATASPAAVNGSAAPLATFNQVRVLVSDGDKAREREGVLHVGGGQVALMPPGGGAPIVSLPINAVSAIFYARSKQPKWRDASGKEVESRIDLGRLGFLRGERNWIVLLTAGEPVILRIEDAALRTVLPAIEERTGRKIQR
jgi:serine/threonine-protein kinase